MTDRPLVRALTPDDVPLMRELLALFGRAFDDVESYSAYQPDDRYLEKLLNSETFIAISALAGATTIGGLAGYVLPKFEQARSEFYIYDLAVDEPYRRKGVARPLSRSSRRLQRQRRLAIFVQPS